MSLVAKKPKSLKELAVVKIEVDNTTFWFDWDHGNVYNAKGKSDHVITPEERKMHGQPIISKKKKVKNQSSPQQSSLIEKTSKKIASEKKSKLKDKNKLEVLSFETKADFVKDLRVQMKRVHLQMKNRLLDSWGRVLSHTLAQEQKVDSLEEYERLQKLSTSSDEPFFKVLIKETLPPTENGLALKGLMKQKKLNTAKQAKKEKLTKYHKIFAKSKIFAKLVTTAHDLSENKKELKVLKKKSSTNANKIVSVEKRIIIREGTYHTALAQMDALSKVVNCAAYKSSKRGMKVEEIIKEAETSGSMYEAFKALCEHQFCSESFEYYWISKAILDGGPNATIRLFLETFITFVYDGSHTKINIAYERNPLTALFRYARDNYADELMVEFGKFEETAVHV